MVTTSVGHTASRSTRLGNVRSVWPASVQTERADHDQVGAQVGGEPGDLRVGLAGAHVQARAPVRAVAIERLEHRDDALGQPLLEVLARLPAVFLRDEEVQVGRHVTRGLIERVLDHDVRVLRKVDADHHAIAPRARQDRFTQLGI